MLDFYPCTPYHDTSMQSWLQNTSACGGTPSTKTVIGPYIQVQKQAGQGNGYDTAFALDEFLTTQGTLIWTFDDLGGLTSGEALSVGLKNATTVGGESAFYLGCGPIFGGSMAAFPNGIGFGVIHAIFGGQLTARVWNGATLLDFNAMLADVWSIVVEGTVVDIYQNSILRHTGSTVGMSGTDLHAAINFYQEGAKATLRYYGTSILRP